MSKFGLVLLLAACAVAAVCGLRATERAGYLGNQVYSGAERRVTYWYSANDLNTASDAINAVGLHPKAMWGVALYCGYSVSSTGTLERDITNRWYCDGKDSVIPKFQSAGADVEVVITDTKNYRFLFDRPQPFINSVVKLARRHSLYGVNLDFEPEQGLKIRGKDAQRYAAFLKQLKLRLNAINVRLTVNVGDWNPMLAQYFTLQHSVDRLVNLQTYKATDYVSWLSTYNNMVNAHVDRSKVAIGFATYPYTIDPANNPKWMSDPSGADARIAQLIADGVPEIYVFKLDPSHGVPETFWWSKFAQFSSKAEGPYQGLPALSPRRLRDRTLAHNQAVSKFGREANIFTAAPINALPVSPEAAAAARNAYNVAADASAAVAAGKLASIGASLQAAQANPNALALATPLSPAAAVIAAGLAPAAAASSNSTKAAVGTAAAGTGAAAATSTGPASGSSPIPIVSVGTAAGASAPAALNWQHIIDSVKGNSSAVTSDASEQLVRQAKDYANQRIAAAIAQAEEMIAAAKVGKWSPNGAGASAAAAAAQQSAQSARVAAAIGVPSSAQASTVSGLLIGSNPAAAAKVSFDATATSNLVSTPVIGAGAAGAPRQVQSYQQLLTSILSGANPALASAAASSFSSPASSSAAAAAAAATTPESVKGTPWANVLGSLKNLQSMVSSANATIPRCASSTGAAAPIAVAPRVSNNQGALKSLKARVLNAAAAAKKGCGAGCNATDIKVMSSMLKQLLSNQDAMLDAHGIPRKQDDKPKKKVEKKRKLSKAERKALALKRAAREAKKHELHAAKIRGARPSAVLKILRGKLPAFPGAPRAPSRAQQRPLDISAPAGIKVPTFNLKRRFHPEINKSSPAFQSDMEREQNARAVRDIEGDLFAAGSLNEQHLEEAKPIIARHDKLHQRLLHQIPANAIEAEAPTLANSVRA